MQFARIGALITLATGLAAAQDVPYYPRGAEQDQDLGAVNQNFRNLADQDKDQVGGATTVNETCWDEPTLCVDPVNRRVNLGPNGLRFDDGTTQRTAASPSNIAVLNDTSGNKTTTATSSPGTTVSGSTLTLNNVAANSRVLYCCKVVCDVDANLTRVIQHAFVDGDFFGGTNAEVVSFVQHTANNQMNCSWCLMSGPLSAGTHNFWFSFWGGSGTKVIYANSTQPLHCFVKEE